jgi:flagellar hook-associated protein 2
MPDIYVPGIKSRFNTDVIVEDLMKIERIPKDRAEKTVESLETHKGYWQELGRRITSLRESARTLYSFQNPFNERVALSSDESVLSGTATRHALEQERTFTVKQVAKADRFLSDPLESSYKVSAGNYTFKTGENEISLNFRGGSLKEFTEALNRRGRDKIQASTLTVKPGTQSLLIESLETGAGNRLGFGSDSEEFARNVGMIESASGARHLVQETAITVEAGKNGAILIRGDAATLGSQGGILSLETSTKLYAQEEIPAPPSGPVMPAAGSVSYGGITIENDGSSVPAPAWTPPPAPPKVDDMVMLSLKFTDGSEVKLPALRDSAGFTKSEYWLSDIANGKTPASLEIVNNNTHRDVSVRGIVILDPETPDGYSPKNPVSTAQDAIVEMEGIEIRRPTNNIDDLLPGVTVTARAPSDDPVRLSVEPDREGVKDALIAMVGNYNRLMAEINVLTRNDDHVIQELNYLSAEEQTDMKKRLGVFAGENSLIQFKNTIQRSTGAPYPTMAEQELSLLSQIGIGTDVRRAGSTTGYDPSRLRGYLEIDEKALDAALADKLMAIQQLFGTDTDGDLIVDSGVAHNIDVLTKPYVETGGIVSLKTGTIDSKINQEQRRITTLDRQLEAKEASLKKQYGQMESAFTRMERMSTEIEQRLRVNNGR